MQVCLRDPRNVILITERLNVFIYVVTLDLTEPFTPFILHAETCRGARYKRLVLKKVVLKIFMILGIREGRYCAKYNWFVVLLWKLKWKLPVTHRNLGIQGKLTPHMWIIIHLVCRVLPCFLATGKSKQSSPFPLLFF